jgi:hypothetical protein
MTANTQIDPELEYLLEASGDDDQVEVTLLLRRPADPQALLARFGLDAETDVTSPYIERVGVISVRAAAAAIRQLVTQPEVEMASAVVSDE